MTRTYLLIALATSLVLMLAPLPLPNVPVVYGSHDPTDFVLSARTLGWNDTSPPRNPTVIEFRTVEFTVRIMNPDTFHNFAIYTANFSGTVSTSNMCDPQRTTPGCLKRTEGTISPSGPTSRNFNFTPTVPQDNGAGPGGYEYFCEIHPTTMHGKVKVLKDPDLNNNGQVDLPDATSLGQAYGTGPSNPAWNSLSDFNNDLKVNIFDAAILGRYYSKILVD